jgi:hypothetical protein
VFIRACFHRLKLVASNRLLNLETLSVACHHLQVVVAGL